jgi:hypothetical protein
MAFSYFEFVVPWIKYNYSFSTFNVGITHYKLYSKPIQFHIYVFSTFSPFLPSVNFSLWSFSTFGHILGSVILRSVILRSDILPSVILRSVILRSVTVSHKHLYVTESNKKEFTQLEIKIGSALSQTPP